MVDRVSSIFRPCPPHSVGLQGLGPQSSQVLQSERGPHEASLRMETSLTDSGNSSGHWYAETFLLATIQIRQGLEKVSVRTGLICLLQHYSRLLNLARLPEPLSMIGKLQTFAVIT